MTGGFLDWAGRVIMLVLAGMVTLSIIGSIAAIPSRSIETRMGLETQAPPPADPQSLSEPQRREVESRDREAAQDRQPTEVAGAAAPQDSDAEQWLEAITYALLALVGLSALAVLILWRTLAMRRRIATALEDLAARR